MSSLQSHYILSFSQKQQQHTSYSSSNNNNNNNNRYNRHNSESSSSDWTNIIPTIGDSRPSVSYKTSFTYTGNFVFYGLSPSTEYEVIIQSRNKEGWSDPNDIFKFSTRSRDYNPMELASHDQQGYSSSSSILAVDFKMFAALIFVMLSLPTFGR